MATPADAPESTVLHKAVAARLTAEYGIGHWSRGASEAGVLRSIRDSTVLLARRGAIIVGTLRLATKKPWSIDLACFTPAPRPLYLLDMAVLPPLQGPERFTRVAVTGRSDGLSTGTSRSFTSSGCARRPPPHIQSGLPVYSPAIVSKVLLIFIDGVGIGRPDPERNPLAELCVLGNLLPDDWSPQPDGGRPASLPELRRLRPLPRGGEGRSVDASLGVRGLPQSATGQTTLFTGVNGAEVMGHHLYGCPGPTLQRTILAHSILKQIHEIGLRAAFLNAYRPLFFERGEAIWSEVRMSASSWTNRAAGLPFMSYDDLAAGKALYHDFTLRDARTHGYTGPELTPEEAGRQLVHAAAPFDLAIYEYFLTDRVGHTGDQPQARRLADELDRFLAAAVEAADLDTTHLIVTSDHGNVEDMSTRSHTHHPVPGLVWGPRAATLLGRLGRLEDFAGVIREEVTGSAA